MNRNPISYILLLCVTTLMLCQCKHTEEKKADVNAAIYVSPSVTLSKQQLELIDVKLAPITERLIYPTIFSSGMVAALPNHEATVSTRIPGVIKEVYVVEGSSVRKGEPILLLSSTELVQLQQDYLSALVEMRFFQKEYERQSTLRKENVGALSEFQQVESKYLNAVSKEKTLKEKLVLQDGVDPNDLQDPIAAVIKTEFVLKSPINGYIYNMPSRIGMRAEPGNVLAEIIDLTVLRADINVYEKDLAIISENQNVEIQFINKKIPSVVGKIDNISRTIDKTTRSVVLHTSFKAPAGYLVIPEMSITAKIKGINSGQMAKTVPNTAIYEENDQSFIFYCQKPDTTGAITFKKGKVRTKTNDGEFVEIEFEEMIPNHVLVATSNVQNIRSEMRKAEQAQ